MSVTAACGRQTVILFGDSLTQWGSDALGGWASRMTQFYRRKADVLNRGFSGYTTRNAGVVAGHVFNPSVLFEGTKYLLTTICLGANDSAGNDLQHVPVDEYEERLGTIVQAARATSQCVVVISPPPVDTARWPDRSCAKVAEYTKACQRVVAKHSTEVDGGREAVLFVDMLATMGATEVAAAEPEAVPAWHDYLSDGLHLSPEGNRVFFEAIVAAVETRGPVGVHPNGLPLDYPVFRAVSGADGVKGLTDDALVTFRANPVPLSEY